MNILLFANSAVVTPLQKFAHWLFADKRPALRSAAPQHVTFATKSIAGYASNTKATASFHSNLPLQAKPLRVVRVMESGQAASSVGRMVISGRMADVCAELDRLAAREAALS